jgi:hypothetical protein
MSDITRTLLQKSELSAARLALVSEAPVAKRVARRAQDENAALQAQVDRCQAQNKQLHEENTHLLEISEELGTLAEELKQENDLLRKENVELCARLNRPAFLSPRKGRLPPREEEGARVVELDDDPAPEPEPEPESETRDGQKLVRVVRRKT